MHYNSDASSGYRSVFAAKVGGGDVRSTGFPFRETTTLEISRTLPRPDSGTKTTTVDHVEKQFQGGEWCPSSSRRCTLEPFSKYHYLELSQRYLFLGIRPRVDAPSHLSLKQSVSRSGIRDGVMVYHIPHMILTFPTITSFFYSRWRPFPFQPALQDWPRQLWRRLAGFGRPTWAAQSRRSPWI